MANTTRMMMKTVHSTKGQPKGARAVASKRKSLLMGVSALTLLLGTPAVLVPVPAFAACAPTNTPTNGQTVICDAGTDTTGIQATVSSDVTVTVTSSGAIDTTASGNDAIVLYDGASITIANGGSVIAEETAIILRDDGFIDIAGSVSNTADYTLMTLGRRTNVIVRGTGRVESEDSGIHMTNGSLEVEAGGRIEVSRGSAVYMSGSTETESFVATIAGTVLAQGEAHGFNLASDYATINLSSGGSIRALSTGSNPRHAIVALGNSVLNLNGTVETSGASQSHAVIVFGRNTAVTIGPDGSIVTDAAQSSGIMSEVGEATIVVENGGEITAEGNNAFGIRAMGGGNSITVEAGGSVVSKGTGANADAIRVDQSSSGISTVRIDGTVEAEGTNVYAIRAASAHVIVSGTVSSDNTAIQFFRNLYGDEANINRLELQPGFTINGSAWGSNDPAVQDILAFGGDSGSGSFDVARIGTLYTSGAQFAEFEGYEKISTSTWTLTGTNNDLDPSAPWEVVAGTLLVNAAMNNTSFTVRSDATLGGTGTVENIGVNGGGMLAAGGVGSIGTLTTGGTLVLSPSSVLHFDLGRSAGVPIGDLIKVGTTLTLDGGYVDIADAGDFGTGVYTLIEYGGLTVLSGTPVVRTNPDGSLTYAVSTTTSSGPGAGEMRLTVSGGAGGNIQYWDADGATAGAQGGTGVWDATNTNWIDDGGSTNVVWGSQFAVFDGTAGTVTVEGSQTFTGLQFLKDYTIVAGTGGGLVTSTAATDIRVGTGITATISAPITGTGGIVKQGLGTLEINGAHAWSGNTVVRSGDLNVDGATLTTAHTNIADVSGSVADVFVRNGASWTQNWILRVGQSGTGTLGIYTGSSVSNGITYVGEDGGSNGTITVSGTNSSLTTDNLRVGRSGEGALYIAAAAAVVVDGTALVGERAGSNGHIEVVGSGSRLWGGTGGSVSLRVGQEGEGSLLIAGGGQVLGYAAGHVAENAGSIGTAIIRGDNSLWDTGTAGLSVGAGGHGSLTIENRGEARSGFAVIGSADDSSGDVLITGTGSAWTVTNALNIGSFSSSGSGTLTLADGGTMSSATARISSRGGADSVLNIGAAAGSGGAVAGILDTPVLTFDVVGAGSATLVFNHTAGAADNYGFSADLISNATGNGNILHQRGVTYYTGNGSDFTGSTDVDGGQLFVSDSLGGAITVSNGAVLGGTGTLGDVVLGFGGMLEPGGYQEPGTLTVSSLVFDENAMLRFDLGTPNQVGGDSDLVVVEGDLTLDGLLVAMPAPTFGNGEYTLIQYDNLVADYGMVTVSETIPEGYNFDIAAGEIGTAGEVILTVSGGAAGANQYWDGAGPFGNGTVNGGIGVWNATNTNWTDQNGNAVEAWGEQFAIFRGAAGAVTVEGSQAFTGMQFLTSGYEIVAGTGGELVTSLADTNIRVGSGIAATIVAPITGAGGIVKQEAGTLFLSGANTYTGGTLVNAGVLRAGAANVFSVASAHSVAAGAVLDLYGFDQTIGSLAGAGEVWIDTNTTLTAGGNNANTTFSGVMDGAGEFVKTGSGVLTLTGENTLTGQATIDRGTLSLGDGGTSGSVAGDIVNNNNFLVFNRSDDVIYAGVLSGTGATSFIGSGMTTLTGDSSGLTGQVFVTDGNLRIASGASLGATLLTVSTDGTLSGFGSVAGNVSVEGRLAPGGDTIGTFTVTGDVAFQTGSTYAIRIAGTNPDPSPAATIDSLMVGGAADLTGSTVEIAAIDPRTSYVDGHTYATPILSATGGLGGTEFAGVGMTSDSAFITPTLSYVGNDVFLTIAVTQDFTTAAETFNQFQAASALNDLEQTGDALAVFNTIANMNADDARRAFDLSSGEVHAAGQHVIDQTFALFNRTLRYQGVAGIGSGNVGAQVFTAPLGYGPAVAAGNAGVVAIGDATDYADARVRGAWAAPLGGFGHVDGDGNAAKLDWWNAGLAGGYEGVIDVASGNAVGGFGFGYIHSRGTLDDRLSTFDADGFYLGAYGAWTDGPWSVAGALSYGANRVSTERNIAFIGRLAEADYWTHTIGLSGEASYAFDLADTTKLAPLFTLDAGWSGHGGFTETGAGALNLTSGSQSWTRLDTGLGLALTHTILTENGNVTLEGRAVWEHAFADVVPSQSLALAGSPTGFTVLGPDAGRDRLRIGAGLSWDVSDDMTVRARYDGLFSNSQANHSASIGLNIRF